MTNLSMESIYVRITRKHTHTHMYTHAYLHTHTNPNSYADMGQALSTCAYKHFKHLF